MAQRRYARRLPHWRSSGSTYFVTWCAQRGVADLDGAERDQVLSSLLYFNGARYTVYAAVVMNDHVHVLVRPGRGYALERIVQSWKAYTSKQFGHRTGRVWQPEYYDHVIRNEREFEETLDYIISNPSDRWPEIDSYPWLWLADAD